MAQQHTSMLPALIFTLLVGGCASWYQKACARGNTSACDKLADHVTNKAPLDLERRHFFTTRCERGEKPHCATLMRICKAHGGDACMLDALEYSCDRGSDEGCQGFREYSRHAAEKCSTRQACVDALKTVLALENTESSPENEVLFQKINDKLCHTYKSGEHCAATALLLDAKKDTEEMLKHLQLACTYQHEASCELIRQLERGVGIVASKMAQAMCVQENNPSACLQFGTMLLEMPEQRRTGKQLIKWTCEELNHRAACTACARHRLGCRRSRPQRPDYQPPPNPLRPL